ncbi:MAG: PepSY-associated TM helix domain-containing protein [Pseudomonadota bacterium]
MSMVNQDRTKRLVAIHGWSGTVLGLFLYVVLLTGAISVFALEIGQWSSGGTRSETPLDQPLDARLRELAGSVDAEYRDEVTVFATSSGVIQAFFHTHTQNDSGQIEDIGVRFDLDPKSLNILHRHEGFRSELPEDQEGALDEFITHLHINLHAPNPWGLYATGLLGFVMLIAAISGLIMHKHVIKDIFVAPRRSSALLKRKDAHVQAGSWGLPFGFLLAFTGTFFSFAGALGIPILAMVAFGGDQEKLIETVVGSAKAEDATPATLTDIDAVLAHSMEQAESEPLSLVISHWGRADASIQVFHAAAEGNLNGDNYTFDGATGEFLGIKPLIGTEPSLGADILGLMGPLHFGTFGGLLSKLVWFSLGLAACYITLTGLQLWVERRKESRAWAWMNQAIVTVGYGTGVALATAAIAFFVSLPSGATHAWTANGFLIGAGMSIFIGLVVRGTERVGKVLGALLGLSLLVIPVARLVGDGPGWMTLFERGQAVPIGMDIAMVLGAAAVVLLAFRDKPSKPARKKVEVGAELVAG